LSNIIVSCEGLPGSAGGGFRSSGSRELIIIYYIYIFIYTYTKIEIISKN
jgi:hypothetical protein